MDDLPTLITDRLTLNRFTLEDVPRVAELCGDWEIAKTTLHLPHPYTQDIGRAWIESHQDTIERGVACPFAVRLTKGGELIGCVGLHPNTQHRRAEIGYWVGVPFWGQGYCTEAARAVIGFGFTTLDLNAITCGYFVGNHASQRVMAKLGIIHEGVRRQHVFRHDRYIDLAVGTLLRDQLRHRRAT